MDGKGRIGDQLRMPKQTKTSLLTTAEETEALGRALGKALRAGDAVLLSGPVGAGKTTLARAAIAHRTGYAEDIPSPTFTLVQTYQADAPIWHSDLYRVTDADEVFELGLEEAFSDAIVFVEWPDRLAGLTPGRRLELTLTPTGKGRVLTARCVGAGWEHVEDALAGAKRHG